MDDLKEHNIYYTDGFLKQHYFTKNDVIHGAYIEFHPNSELKRTCYYHHGTVSGRDLEYYENGKLYMDRYDVKGFYGNYCKLYDEYGSLTTHIIYHNTIKESFFTHEFRAEYTNNILSLYSIDTHIKNDLYEENNDYLKYHVVYNIKPRNDTKFDLWLAGGSDDDILYGKIDLSIINPLRSLQKRFRKHIYSTILNELNHVIKINDLSKLILLYLITYRKN
jgi:hypothetical protein